MCRVILDRGANLDLQDQEERRLFEWSVPLQVLLWPKLAMCGSDELITSRVFDESPYLPIDPSVCLPLFVCLFLPFLSTCLYICLSICLTILLWDCRCENGSDVTTSFAYEGKREGEALRWFHALRIRHTYICMLALLSPPPPSWSSSSPLSSSELQCRPISVVNAQKRNRQFLVKMSWIFSGDFLSVYLKICYLSSCRSLYNLSTSPHIESS